ncbi:MAG: glycosyltransferase family 4 protein [Planctomyces sp.]|nr:glycosyltransferase family 4 protein [Planctomyces sp.]
MNSRLLFISWAPYCSRSDGIAVRLGGQSRMIYSPRWGSRYATVAFKYVSQTFKTLWALFRERPSVVFVMAPPIIAAIPVWLYCLLTGAELVLDAHSGAFDNPRWKGLQWLQRFLSRRAATTIVTGDHFRKLVESWGADATIVTDVPVLFAEPQPVDLPAGVNLVLVCSFCSDEPIAEFLRAAAAHPDVHFHITGNPKGLAAEIRRLAPPNVRLTGFLSDAEYVGLIQAADGVMALTTMDHTMQRAAYEAVYLNTPVITSDFPILRSAFPLGTVHVEPTESGIRDGIAEFVRNRELLAEQVLLLREQKLETWARTAQALCTRFQLPQVAAPTARSAELQPAG